MRPQRGDMPFDDLMTSSGVPIGRANPPDAVKNQRIQTAEQEQRALAGCTFLNGAVTPTFPVR